MGGQATRYHSRPDLAYVPITDLPPIEYGPVWPVGGQTSRVRSFLKLLQAELDR